MAHPGSTLGIMPVFALKTLPKSQRHQTHLCLQTKNWSVRCRQGFVRFRADTSIQEVGPRAGRMPRGGRNR